MIVAYRWYGGMMAMGSNSRKYLPDRDPDPDRELAERMVGGDRRALAQLLDRHLGRVYKYVSRCCGPGNEQLVAEVVRTTFEQAVTMRRLRRYAQGRETAPLLYLLLRLANRHLARKRARIVVTVTGPDDEAGQLRRAIFTLPARQQAALALALFEELPAEDIAGVLGVRVARAMRILRNALWRIGPLVQVQHDSTSADDR